MNLEDISVKIQADIQPPKIRDLDEQEELYMDFLIWGEGWMRIKEE